MTHTTPSAVTAETAKVERILEAPRDRVFKAWLDTNEVANWYGPARAQIPRDGIRIEPRVGGRWEVTMVTPGGTRFVAGYTIETLVAPELLVMRSDPMPDADMPDGTVIRIEFHDLGNQTRLVLTDGPFPPAGSTQAAAGYTAALAKLAAHLAA